MAVNQIQIAPRQAKKDTLDKVLQGLQIAEAAFKIPVDYQQYRAYAADAGMKEDERAGITTREKIGKAGSVVVPADAAQPAAAPAGSGLTPAATRYGAALTPMKVREGDKVSDVMVVSPEADQKFFEGEKGLRGEYEAHPLTKDTTATLTAAQKALTSLNSRKGTLGPADIAGIYSFMHTVESQSAVKGDEFSAAANSAGILQKLANLGEQADKGAILGPKGREAMKAMVGDLVNAQLSVQDVLDDRYTNLANDRKYKPANVVTGFWSGEDSPIRPLKRPDTVEKTDWESLSHVGKRKLLHLVGRKPNSDEE